MKKTLKNKEVKEFIKKIQDLFNLELSKKDKYELQDNLILINGVPKFFYYEDKIVPTLKLILENNFLKKITIDMGAVPYAAKGADMMRPGITEIEDNIENNEVVAIVDETHSKPIALGITLFSGPEIKEMSKGKVIKNIHYIGDEIWKFN